MLIEIKDELIKEIKDLEMERGNGDPVKLGDYINGVLFNEISTVKEIFSNVPVGFKKTCPFVDKVGDVDDLPY